MPSTGNTQQQINYGATANDGTGDPLRTAFVKTDENFDNIWLAGPVGSNVTIVNNNIQANDTNGNIVIKPNGVGVIQANAHIVPNIDSARDLGTANLAWRRIYVDTLNTADLSVAGNLDVSGNLTVDGDIIQIGNLVTDAKTIQLANTAATDAAADGSGITVGASDDVATLLYDSGNNVWTTNIGIQIGGPITGTSVAVSDATIYGNVDAINGNFTGNVAANYFIGNGALLTGITSYGNANAVSYGEAGWSGNIIPSANAVYSLGNATNYWSNLWVANNTIYIGGVPLGITAGNVLTVDGDAVLTNGSNTTISTTGNITADYFFGNIQGLTGNITNLDSLNFAVENISALVGNNGVNIGAGGFNNLVVLPTEVLIQNVPLTVAGNIVANEVNGLYITANAPANGTAQIWNFGTDGRLTFPGTPRIDTGSDNFEVQAAESISLEANAVVNIYTDTSGSAHQWIFDDTGNLVFPGGDTVLYQDGDDFVIECDNEDVIIRSNNDDVRLLADDDVQIRAGYDGGYAVYLSQWEFSNNGQLSSTPVVDGNLFNYGYIQFVGNSSGDLNGYTTLRLVPDATVEANDQYLIIDPTAGGDIHVRAGGAIDASNGRLFLGGENSHFLVNSGVNPNVFVTANNQSWTFGVDGVLQAPGDISAVGNVTGNYFIGDGSQLTGLPASYSDANVASFLAAYGSNTISTTGNVTAGNFIGAGSNVELIAQSEQWVFDTTGNLTLPTGGYLRVQTGIIGSGASPAPTLSGFSSIATTGAQGNISASGNLLALGYANITGNINGSGATFSGNVTAQNFIGNISITGNVQGTTANVQLVAGSYTATFDNTGVLTLPAVGGNEGAELQLTQAANSTLSGNTVSIDQYVDQIRFFEGGGSTRGVYIDLTQAAAGVGTLLNNRVSGFVDAGTFVTMDNIQATVTSSSNRGLSLATTTGSITYNIGGTYGGVGGTGGFSVNAQTLTTTPTSSIFGWNFGAEGEVSTYVLVDKTNNRSYRITVSIGPAYLGNMISIERLI